jgi:hypothetical protein
MSSWSNIERSIEKMRVTTTVAVDERILGDACAALEESVRVKWAGAGPSVWQLIARSKISKLAAAAVIIIAALIGAHVLIGPRETLVETEKKQIEARAAAGDVDGLVRMLSEGQFASKVLAAKYLGEIGDERALPELERLYLAAEEHLPEGYTENPFAGPIKKIKSRIEPEPGEGMTIPDANETVVVDVNEKPVVDANRPVAVDANEAVGANVPAETEGVLDFFVVHKVTGEPVTGAVLDII